MFLTHEVTFHQSLKNHLKPAFIYISGGAYQASNGNP
jgi:hypothetical protein